MLCKLQIQMILTNFTEELIYKYSLLPSEILGGIHTLLLIVQVLPAVIFTYETIKKYRRLKKCNYEDDFTIKMQAWYTERMCRCVILDWFLTVEVAYFVSYNLGVVLEQYGNSNKNFTLSDECIVEENTILSESFSLNPATDVSNLVASVHNSLIVYYLEIFVILLIYLKMGLDENINKKKLYLFAVKATIYWIFTIILFSLPWTTNIGCAVIAISSQIFIVIAIKKTKELLRTFRFKIQDLTHMEDNTWNPVKELKVLVRKYKYFLFNIISIFQILVFRGVLLRTPYGFIESIALNSCYYRVMYGIEISKNLVDFLSPVFDYYQAAELILEEISLSIFFFLMILFNIHLAMVLVAGKLRVKNKWRYGGTADVRSPLL